MKRAQKFTEIERVEKFFLTQTKSIWRVFFKLNFPLKNSSNCNIHQLNSVKPSQFDEFFLPNFWHKFFPRVFFYLSKETSSFITSIGSAWITYEFRYFCRHFRFARTLGRHGLFYFKFYFLKIRLLWLVRLSVPRVSLRDLNSQPIRSALLKIRPMASLAQ